MINVNTFTQKAHEMQAQLVEWRRHLHMHPELSFNETQTSVFVKSILEKHKISYTDGWVKTGIVATIGKKDSPNCVALRGDMDALPIHEKNTCDYVSKNAGVMHACGHDVHTTCALGAAVLLKEMENELDGKIIVVFQPGEEVLPGGASLMLKEGALGNPLPKAIFGLHVFPEMEAGNLGFREGECMASSDEIYLTVKGKGGHAAMRKQYNNPLIIASKLLLSLEDRFSEANTINDTAKPTVLAFGKIEGKGATNVIPEIVEIAGTFRAMDENWRSLAHKLINEIAQSIAKENNADVVVDIHKGYPALTNHIPLTQFAKKTATELWGTDHVKDLDLRMTAEDFAYYSQQMPACFFRLGTRNELKGITSPVHTATFDIDESALAIGAGTMAFLGVQGLKFKV
jgi:amidohydrolase